MISAVAALSLPTAALSDSDRAVVDVLLAELDAHVRKNMSRSGCMLADTTSVGGAMPIDRGRLNGPIWHELLAALRSEGWIAELLELKRPSAIAGSGSLLQVVGHQIALRPTEAAFDEARRGPVASHVMDGAPTSRSWPR